MTATSTGLRRAGTAALAALALLLGMAAAVVPATPAQAAPITDFRPGNIISDGVMYDHTSMSASEVASFISAEGAHCRATTGNTCLKDYRESTPSRPATELCPRPYAGASSETSAAIITKVAVACGINPQVLLVTLQKEQGLVTAPTGKSSRTYARALGFGCPDNTGGWCNPEYAGFANQVYSAAQQLQRYAAFPHAYSHRAYATNHVRYHPDAACGSSPVYIENQATASMYNYTPYQPNAAALAAGSGSGDSCSAYGNRNFHIYFKRWFGLPTENRWPIGHVDSVSATSSETISVRGWAIDRDSSEPIRVHVYVDGVGRASLPASRPRSDIERIYGHDRSGYSGTISVDPGTHDVCVYAINAPRGPNPRLGCRSVTVTNTRPKGHLDAVTPLPGEIAVRGWALDPDTHDPIRVHVYVDGRATASVPADRPRSDIARIYGKGELHGFSTRIPATAGEHRVCVYAIDSSSGPNPSIGCKTVTATNDPPRASLDVVDASVPSSVLVRGWAFDPDDDSVPVTVRYVVDGAVVGTEPAQSLRRDVARVHGVSENHGYSTRIALTQGRHAVCVDALDASTSAVRRVGCRTVDVANTPTVGALTSAAPGTAEVTVSGWAWDYDRPDTPVAITVLVDGAPAGTATADRAVSPRPTDAGRSTVGYTATVPFTPGTREVCVRGSDAGGATPVTLGCQDVTVANSLPFGSVDVAEGGTGTVRVRGWAIDPDTTDSIAVHVRLDGTLMAGFTANTSRPDVDRAHGMGELHGFDRTIPVDVAPGAHQVCLYAINWPRGANPRLDCRDVTVG